MDTTPARIREYLNYDPVTGLLTHVKRPGRLRRGEPATKVDSHGYLKVTIDKRSYKAHRVVWAHVHGEWPAAEIDHINGDRADNRLVNLRLAVHSENGQNRRKASNNRSGITGVSRKGKRWRAQIGAAGKKVHLGVFDSPEEAAAAYADAKRELHPFEPEPLGG